jgi:membrane-associated protein
MCGSLMIRTVGYMLSHLMPLVCSPWLYLIVFLAVAVDGFVPVIPIEALVIGLGAMTATGRPNLLALAAAVTLGGMAGDRVTYLLGRKAGRRLRHRRLVAAKVRAERALLRYGGTAVLIGRFLPWGRAATAMTAGSVSMPLGRYGLFTGLASAAWAAYTIGLGRLGGATFAGSPLLGAAFGMGLGLLLGAVHLVVEKLRKRPDLAVPEVPPAQPTRNVPAMKMTRNTACSATPTISTVRSTTWLAPMRASTSTIATASRAYRAADCIGRPPTSVDISRTRVRAPCTTR